MRPFALLFLTLLVVVCVAAGCGGGEGGGGGGGGEASFDAPPAEKASGGSSFAVGERAYFDLEIVNADSSETTAPFGVTVQGVEEGDSDDIEGLGSNEPVYVQVEYENHSGAPVDLAIGPASRWKLEGSDGELYDSTGVVTIAGEFDLCTRADSSVTEIAPEQALLDCVIFALPPDVSPSEVRFQTSFLDENSIISWAAA